MLVVSVIVENDLDLDMIGHPLGLFRRLRSSPFAMMGFNLDFYRLHLTIVPVFAQLLTLLESTIVALAFYFCQLFSLA